VTGRHTQYVISALIRSPRNHSTYVMTDHLPWREPAGMPTSENSTAPGEQAEDTARSEPPDPPAPPRTIASVAPGPRRTIASYASYADAERAIDWLADQGFPVERGAIVGVGLRSVEQIGGRMTHGRAAFIGAAGGILVGSLLALLAGILPWDTGSGAVLLYAVALAVVFGALSGALVHEALSGGRRDFVSGTRIEADRYDVQMDQDSADAAKRLLEIMPGRSV
jgi:hypothetical protein